MTYQLNSTQKFDAEMDMAVAAYRMNLLYDQLREHKFTEAAARELVVAYFKGAGA